MDLVKEDDSKTEEDDADGVSADLLGDTQGTRRSQQVDHLSGTGRHIRWAPSVG